MVKFQSLMVNKEIDMSFTLATWLAYADQGEFIRKSAWKPVLVVTFCGKWSLTFDLTGE